MIPKAATVLKVGIGVVIASIVAIYAFDQLHIDRCLDTGGSINYDTFGCDLSETHPRVPYLQSRWPRYVLPIVGLVGWVVLAKRVRDRAQSTKSEDDSE